LKAPTLLFAVGPFVLAACNHGCGGGPRPTHEIVVPRGSAQPDVPFKSTGDCTPGRGDDYPVGPGQKLTSIGAVPWERLKAGDTVRIFHRPEPYREKLMVGSVGTKDAPIRVCGVKGPNGELPVIDGDGATTRPSLEYPYDGHQPRGLVFIGHRRSSPWLEQPAYIVIEGLEIRNATPGRSFFDKNRTPTPWPEVAAGIFVQRASHVTIRGCNVHSNGNGLFIGSAGGDELTQDVLIEGNYVHDNASPTNWYEHNVYNEASGVVYQFNRFGPPRRGAEGFLGGNIKERSAGAVIRYNWIEDGAHLIDLVDSQEARDRNLPDPTFHESWVYGNVLIRGGSASGSMVHYGGDSGLLETYRKGTLRFFHNTVLVLNASHKEWESSAVFELSTNEEKLDLRNNVIMTEVPSVPRRPTVLLGARDEVCAGIADLSGNWIADGVSPFEGFPGKEPKRRAEMRGFDASLRGADPMVVDLAKLQLQPSASAPFKGKGGALAGGAHAITMQYVKHGQGEPRPKEDSPTPGALAPR
jgi:Right handed beta helix region